MFCSNCGNELKEGARFCPSCGKPVAHAASAQAGAGGSSSQYTAPYAGAAMPSGGTMPYAGAAMPYAGAAMPSGGAAATAKSPLKYIIAGIIAIAVLGAAIALAFNFFGATKSNSPEGVAESLMKAIYSYDAQSVIDTMPDQIIEAQENYYGSKTEFFNMLSEGLEDLDEECQDDLGISIRSLLNDYITYSVGSATTLSQDDLANLQNRFESAYPGMGSQITAAADVPVSISLNTSAGSNDTVNSIVGLVLMYFGSSFLNSDIEIHTAQVNGKWACVGVTVQGEDLFFTF